MDYPPINIEEEDDQFVLEFFAAGYRKEDFMITVADDKLTVSAKVERDGHGRHRHGRLGGEQPRKHSFRPRSFQRAFILSDKVDTGQLKAAYTDGMLRIALPKKAGMETLRSEIRID